MSIIIKDSQTFETHVVDIVKYIKYIKNKYDSDSDSDSDSYSEIEGNDPNLNYGFFLGDIELEDNNINIISDGDIITKELMYYSAYREHCILGTAYGQFQADRRAIYKRNLTFIDENDDWEKYDDNDGGLLLFLKDPTRIILCVETGCLTTKYNFLYPIYVPSDEICPICDKILNKEFYCMDYFGLRCECRM